MIAIHAVVNSAIILDMINARTLFEETRISLTPHIAQQTSCWINIWAHPVSFSSSRQKKVFHRRREQLVQLEVPEKKERSQADFYDVTRSPNLGLSLDVLKPAAPKMARESIWSWSQCIQMSFVDINNFAEKKKTWEGKRRFKFMFVFLQAFKFSVKTRKRYSMQATRIALKFKSSRDCACSFTQPVIALT